MNIVEDNLIGIFSKMHVAFRTVLSIPVTNCESEQSLSVLFMIKNKYPYVMDESRLTSLSIIPTECDLTSNISFEGVKGKFTKRKSRKKCFKR